MTRSKFFLFHNEILYSLFVYCLGLPWYKRLIDYQNLEIHQDRVKNALNDFIESKNMQTTIDNLNLIKILNQEFGNELGSKKFRILDFGAGDFKLFSILRDHFLLSDFDYYFVETENFVSELISQLQDSEISFRIEGNELTLSEYPNLHICSRTPQISYDLILMGAVIGWVDSPVPLCQELTKLSTRIYVSRTLMSENISFRGVQRNRVLGRVRYQKCWFFRKFDLISAFDKALIDSWDSANDRIYTYHGVYKFQSMFLKSFETVN